MASLVIKNIFTKPLASRYSGEQTNVPNYYSNNHSLINIYISDIEEKIDLLKNTDLSESSKDIINCEIQHLVAEAKRTIFSLDVDSRDEYKLRLDLTINNYENVIKQQMLQKELLKKKQLQNKSIEKNKKTQVITLVTTNKQVQNKPIVNKSKSLPLATQKQPCVSAVTSNKIKDNEKDDEIIDEDLAKLIRIKNQLLECNEMGENTHNNLVKQREIIIESVNKLEKVGEELSLSNKLLNKMKSWWRD